jgi:hypothetical protein
MAIFEVSRSAYPNAIDQGRVLGTLHFEGVPESLDERITSATGELQEPFEAGSLVTLRDAIALPDSIVQLVETGSDS